MTELVSQNIDSDEVIDSPDTRSCFHLDSQEQEPEARDSALRILRLAWEQTQPRQQVEDKLWISGLAAQLIRLADMRIKHVEKWLNSNLLRFKANNAYTEDLRRRYEAAKVELRTNVELCRMKCNACNLLCVKSRLHDPQDGHDCDTSHECLRPCDFCEGHVGKSRNCSYRYVIHSQTLLIR
jgi:hypothetical protein